MKSRISIEIDYDKNNEPVIQILKRKSDDVRDGLIQAFLEKLQHQSSWCKISWVNNNRDPNDEFDVIRLYAVAPNELREQSRLMEAAYQNNLISPAPNSTSQEITDNP